MKASGKTPGNASGKVSANAAPCDLPASSLLLPYQTEGHFTDCFFVETQSLVSLEQFVTAFYSTRLFRMERVILEMALGKSSSARQVRELATGTAERLAAWRVEARHPHQLLLSDYRGQTRSWLMVDAPKAAAREAGCTIGAGPTMLYFGSAIVSRVDSKTDKRSMSRGFKSLLSLHTMYSKALLNSALNLLHKELN